MDHRSTILGRSLGGGPAPAMLELQLAARGRLPLLQHDPLFLNSPIGFIGGQENLAAPSGSFLSSELLLAQHQSQPDTRLLPGSALAVQAQRLMTPAHLGDQALASSAARIVEAQLISELKALQAEKAAGAASLLRAIPNSRVPPSVSTLPQPPQASGVRSVSISKEDSKLDSLAAVACAMSEQQPAQVGKGTEELEISGTPTLPALATLSVRKEPVSNAADSTGERNSSAAATSHTLPLDEIRCRRKKERLLFRRREKRPYRHVGFPEKLYRLLMELEADGRENVASFTSDGKAVQVHREQEFETILPQYFRHAKMSSFERQLLLYGFIRIKRGPNRGAFEHELFYRGCEERLKEIKRP